MNCIYFRTKSLTSRASCYSRALALLMAVGVCLRLHSAPSHVEGELLLKWKDGPESYAAAIGNAQVRATVKRNFNALGWQKVKLPSGLSVRDGMQAYQALGTVLAMEPNGAITVPHIVPPSESATADIKHGRDAVLSVPEIEVGEHSLRTLSTESLTQAASAPVGVIPNDPRFKDQWYLKKIGATNAWATTTGSSNVVVAVIDTGVDYKHPDLAANMWRNPGETGLDANGNDKATNGIDDDGNGYVDDVYGVDVMTGSGDPMDTGFFFPPAAPFYHGTFCAGIIGAVGNNGVGITGLNWNCQIMAIHFYGDLSKDTDQAVVSRTLAAYDYVVMMKRRGINIRVTSNSVFSNGASMAIRDAMALAGREGILNVCIAGNQPNDQDLLPISFPGAYDERSIVSVAASNESDRLTDFSGYGRSTVDIAAPGINIISTVKGGGYLSGGQGTSFACPQVAGAAALLLSANSGLTVDQIKAALFGSVDQPASLKGKLFTNGRLNVSRALDSLTNANPPVIITYASPAGRRADPLDPIQVTFSQPMNRGSTESAFAIQPAIAGTFEWGTDSRSFSFRHDQPFDVTTEYSVRIAGTAEQEGGGTLDGNFNHALESSPTDDFVWSFRFPVPGDDFANAQNIEGTSGSVLASDRYATGEFFEGDHAGASAGASMWYRWVPPTPGGWFTFDLTSGTAFDSLLAIKTGDILGNLTEVAGNDNFGTKLASRVSFLASSATNYSLVVASKAAGISDLIDPTKTGNFKLAWYPTPPPSFTGAQFSPASGMPGTKVTLTGTNFTGATGVLFNGSSASFSNALANNLDLKITAIVPADATSGSITIVTPHGSVISADIFEVLPLPVLAAAFTAQGMLILSWPETLNGFVLESTAGFSPPNWQMAAEIPIINNGRWEVTASANPGQRYFRLRKP
ncbi:MAG: S8 family serine peptidase [Verrucomicrobia bacterium]|nr:S8 family serine peptidase [Verrucomicrobiota bacterium]